MAEGATLHLIGTLGAGVYLTPKLFLSLGSDDNTRAVLSRPGITFRSK